MFLYPLSGMVGILYEHSHRLLGALVVPDDHPHALDCGERASTLAMLAGEYRPWASVILQGALGGLRVVATAPTLAIVHAGAAQAFFALLVCITFFTSPARPDHSAAFRRTSCATASSLSVDDGVLYVQIVFGAILRHTGARLDAHLALAALAAFLVIVLNMYIWRSHGEEDTIVHPVLLLSALLLAQLSLGLGAYLVRYTPMAAGWRRQSFVSADPPRTCWLPAVGYFHGINLADVSSRNRPDAHDRPYASPGTGVLMMVRTLSAEPAGVSPWTLVRKRALDYLGLTKGVWWPWC